MEHASASRHIITCITPPSPIWWSFAPAIISALIGPFALSVAVASLRASRKIARDRATLDLIEKRESTERYRRIHRTFYELRTGEGFEHLAGDMATKDPKTGRDNAKDRQDIIDYLNHYELVAIGIQRKLLDASTYRAWMQGAYVRDWNAAADWVQRERWEYFDGQWQYRSSIFAAYQAVACSWSEQARVLNKDSGGPPTGPPSPGDEPLPTPSGKI